MDNIYSRAVPTRAYELVEALKSEIEGLSQESSLLKHHKVDFEHKIAKQLQEMQTIQKAIYSLEESHCKHKQSYEEEIVRLRRRIEELQEQLQHGQVSGNSVAAPTSNPPTPATAAAPSIQSAGQNTTSARNPNTNDAPTPNLLSGPSPPPPGSLTAGTLPPAGPFPSSHRPTVGKSDYQGATMPSMGLSQGNYFSGLIPKNGNSNGPSGTSTPKIPTIGTLPTSGPMPNAQKANSIPWNGNKNSSVHQNSSSSINSTNSNKNWYPGMNDQKEQNPQNTAMMDNSRNGGDMPQNAPSNPRFAQSQSLGPATTSTTAKIPSQPPATSVADDEIMHREQNIAEFADKFQSSYKEDHGSYKIIRLDGQRNLDIELVHTLVHDSVVCCVKFSTNGKLLATGCSRSVFVFDVATGEAVCSFENIIEAEASELYVRSLAFSPDNLFLAIGAEDKHIRILNLETKRTHAHLVGHDQDIYSLDWSASGRFIASGSGDRTARVWDVKTHHCVSSFTIEEGVTAVAFSPDEKYLAAGTLDTQIRIWSLESGELVERLQGHKESVYALVFAPSGREILSGSLDKTIRLWDVSMNNQGTCRSVFYGHANFVLSVSLSPDLRWVVSGSRDHHVVFWDTATAKPILILEGHGNSIISVNMSPEGQYFATGSGDEKARIWRYIRRD